MELGSVGVSWEREQGQVRQTQKCEKGYEREKGREKEWSNARDMENERKLAKRSLERCTQEQLGLRYRG